MTTLYKKVGRRYRPVAEHEEWDSYPAGAHLVICHPGSTMCRFSTSKLFIRFHQSQLATLHELHGYLSSLWRRQIQSTE